MDNQIEQEGLCQALNTVIQSTTVSMVLINIVSTNQEVTKHVDNTLSSAGVLVKNEEENFTLPRLFDSVRGRLAEFEKVLIINATHHLGWPQIEYCSIDMQNCQTQSGRQAIFANNPKVLNGEPFYDSEIL